MNSFKILLKFSLEKRIKNKTFIITNVLILFVMGCLLFADLYIEDLFPSLFEKPVIYVDDTNLYEFLSDFLGESFEVNVADYEIDMINENGKYLIESEEEYAINIYSNEDSLQLSMIQNALLTYDQLKNEAILNDMGLLNSKEIVVYKEINNDSEKQSWGFAVVTGIYFFAMSFAAVVANDVVYEKATRMMELILTSTSASVHLLSKLCAGWLMLIIQFGTVLMGGVSLLIIRFAYDRFEGLIHLLIRLGYMEGEYKITFSYIFDLLKDNYLVIGKIGLGVLIMLMGILLVQAILMILSSFISNIEEAGTVQSPFYLLLLAVYYLSIFMDNPQAMEQGIGKTLSMVPFFSMLFMPLRMFSYNVTNSEILMSLMNSMTALAITLLIGSGIYKKGVLDYNGTNMVDRFRLKSKEE